MLSAARSGVIRTAEQAVLGIGGAVLRSRLVDELAQQVVRYGVIERVTEPLIQSGELERIVATVLDTPAARRLTRQLLESEELWVVVDEIARSPAVTEAIGHQGAGLAEEVAGAVRARSRSVTLEPSTE